MYATLSTETWCDSASKHCRLLESGTEQVRYIKWRPVQSDYCDQSHSIVSLSRIPSPHWVQPLNYYQWWIDEQQSCKQLTKPQGRTSCRWVLLTVMLWLINSLLVSVQCNYETLQNHYPLKHSENLWLSRYRDDRWVEICTSQECRNRWWLSYVASQLVSFSVPDYLWIEYTLIEKTDNWSQWCTVQRHCVCCPVSYVYGTRYTHSAYDMPRMHQHTLSNLQYT